MTEHERRELEWTWTGSGPVRPLKRGDLGPKVKQVQEWLCLADFHTAIDGDFGPATEAALKAFQQATDAVDADRWTLGAVDAGTWRALTRPLWSIVNWTRDGLTTGRAIVHAAETHLAWRAREVGIPNGGPFVRGLYMDGHEGPDWPWCAGFATYVLRQALGHDKWRTFSCDELAHMAKLEGRWFHLTRGHEMLKPGSLFLIRNPAPDRRDDWTHCGIVTAVGAEHFETIEGNTNQGGSREGTEVCKRVRAFGPRVDFILTVEGA